MSACPRCEVRARPPHGIRIGAQRQMVVRDEVVCDGVMCDGVVLDGVAARAWRWMRRIVLRRSSSLILRSRGEPQEKEGAWLTSSSHGLPFLSRSTSNPRISKHVKPTLSSPSSEWYTCCR